MAKKESKTMRLFQYLVSKDQKTKYLKLNDNPKASKKEKAMIKALKKLLGSDVLYINLFDDKFRKKFKVPKFVKGTVALVEKDEDEDDEDDEDEEEDEDQDDDDDDDEDEDDEDEDDEDDDGDEEDESDDDDEDDDDEDDSNDDDEDDED